MNNITSALLCRPVHNIDYMLQFRWHFIVLKFILFIQRKCLVKYIIFLGKNFSKTVLTMVQFFLKSTKNPQSCNENH